MQIINNKNIVIFVIILLFFCTIKIVIAEDSLKVQNWPKFGLVFQTGKDYDFISKRYDFYWGKQEVASKLRARNPHGVYVPAYNVFSAVPFGNNRFCPDINYISTHHPEWLRYYKDGRPIAKGRDDKRWVRLDIGNPAYVDYVIDWVRQQAFAGSAPVKDVGFDNAMFMYADSKWAKYDTHEAYREAWEYFLRRISEAFRPQHKVILNVGSCDLPTFARMIKWVDGVLGEDLCTPAHDLKFNPDKARQVIQERWQKGQWCAENGKIWAMRYRATINALKLAPAPGTPSFFLSVGDREIIVSSLGRQVLGKIDLTRPNADTVGKVAKCLKDFNINVTVATPYPETPSPGAFQPLTYTKVEGDLTMKLKQAPREAFLFGYAGVLMAAGPNSYFILGDERHQEYYYPEMDWALGAPQGEMREVTPQVFRRDFQNYAAYLNLSQAPFPLPDSRALAPFRGALVPLPR